jgi:hypothetical protein
LKGCRFDGVVTEVPGRIDNDEHAVAGGCLAPQLFQHLQIGRQDGGIDLWMDVGRKALPVLVPATIPAVPISALLPPVKHGSIEQASVMLGDQGHPAA